jgi:hypothetical protein
MIGIGPKQPYRGVSVDDNELIREFRFVNTI